jgi:ribosomal-protein-alanine N-acetyltransferase
LRANEKPVLRTPRLTLRMGAPQDIPAILRFYGDNRHFFKATDPPRPAQFYTEPYWTKRLRSMAVDYVQDRACSFFLFPVSSEREDEVVGAVNFSNFIRGAFQACYLGYALAQKEQGKGLMTEALRAAIQFAWGTLKLHRVMANYLPQNERSAGVLRRLGFVEEGYAKSYLFIDGRWQDHVLTSLTNGAHRWEPPP